MNPIFSKLHQWLTPKTDKGLIEEPSKLDNAKYNKRLWNEYAKNWHKDSVYIEDPGVESDDKAKYLHFIGDEWGNKRDVDSIVKDYILEFVDSESIAAEIGSGGGRVASKVANHVAMLSCFDISDEMLQKAKGALKNFTNITYVLLEDCNFPNCYEKNYDFVYSFDVFVHLDLHTIWKYFKEINSILKVGGRVFLHTANLMSPGGWEKFEKQDHYTVEGFYFLCPQLIELMSLKSNFRLIKSSSSDPSNYYLNRDFLFVMEKVADISIPK